jgi:transcriptional antiterminator RfaH
MSHSALDESVCWYAIHTKPRQEDRADLNLRAWNVPTFSPKIKERRFNPASGGTSFVTAPLFPQYIFARFRASELFHKVCFTRGVHRVVSFGAVPVPLAEDVITFLQAQRGADGLIKVCDELSAGDKVMIKAGPFKNLIGIFEQELTGAARVSILLTAINFQGRIIIDRDWIQKVEAHS